VDGWKRQGKTNQTQRQLLHAISSCSTSTNWCQERGNGLSARTVRELAEEAEVSSCDDYHCLLFVDSACALSKPQEYGSGSG